MFDQKDIIPEMEKLRRFARRLTRDAGNADDLLQSTLLRALEKRDYFEEGTNLFGWMSKIMFNIFASQYRRTKKFEAPSRRDDYMDGFSMDAPQEACTDLAIVRDSMKRMSAEHREILTMIAVRGLQYEEVAHLLKIPVGTVRSRLSRARALLRDALEPCQPAPVLRPLHMHRRGYRRARAVPVMEAFRREAVLLERKAAS